MSAAQVHYELFIRRQPASPWTLDLATENRAQALETAESILTKGEISQGKVKKAPEHREALCVTPGDLYTMHARDRTGRLLEGWLARQKATPFELLHRPDLAEKLDASGVDLQHAIQKIAVPEAQARDASVHELMRTFQGLAERTIERLLKDHRQGLLPDLEKETFAAAAERVAADPDPPWMDGRL